MKPDIPTNNRLQSFMARHCKNRMEEMRLMVFLTDSAMLIFGMPLHFALGLIGYKGLPLQAISFGMWLCSIAFLLLFLTHRFTLTKAFFWLSVAVQIFESGRIVYLAAMTRPDWLAAHQMLLLVNEVLSLCNLIVACMGLVPKAPTVVLVLFALAEGAAYAICPEVMLSQFVLLFFFSMTGVWLYSLVMQRVVSSTRQELDDYKQFQDSVVDMFNMSKAEVVSLIQLSRGAGRSDGMDSKVLANLSEHTRHNLIALGAYLKNERRDQTVDLAAVFPQLTPAELGVARLILKDMTLKEIAVATGKSLSNVGTVRGNMRKKLGLAPDDDLREWLLAEVKNKTGGRFSPSNLLNALRGGGGKRRP